MNKDECVAPGDCSMDGLYRIGHAIAGTKILPSQDRK